MGFCRASLLLDTEAPSIVGFFNAGGFAATDGFLANPSAVLSLRSSELPGNAVSGFLGDTLRLSYLETMSLMLPFLTCVGRLTRSSGVLDMLEMSLAEPGGVRKDLEEELANIDTGRLRGSVPVLSLSEEVLSLNPAEGMAGEVIDFVGMGNFDSLTPALSSAGDLLGEMGLRRPDASSGPASSSLESGWTLSPCLEVDLSEKRIFSNGDQDSDSKFELGFVDLSSGSRPREWPDWGTACALPLVLGLEGILGLWPVELMDAAEGLLEILGRSNPTVSPMLSFILPVMRSSGIGDRPRLLCALPGDTALR